MKKTLRILLIFILCAAFTALSFPRAESSYSPPFDTVKIGLYFGSNTLSSANLENATGSGYEFGYFDSSREFNAVGYTARTTITMMKDHNIYLSSGKYTDEKPSGGDYSTIGCYHIRLSRGFDSFENALETANGLDGAFPAYYSGSYAVCVGNYSSYGAASDALASSGLNGDVFTASSKCVTVTVTGTTRIIFEYDDGDSTSLAVNPRAGDGEKAVTWFKGYKYYGAFQYTRLNGDDLTVVNVLNIEDYVKGVVPYEMSPSWDLEALKAQALCARTYSMSHLNNHRSYGFDLCNQTDCQAYRGTASATAVTDRAVDETAGQYITYDGELCDTFYFSSDGGATENSENVWNAAIPYLRAVIDPYEKNVNTGRSSWTFTYTNADITNILKAKGYKCSDIVGVIPTYTEVGNIYSLKFLDSNGVTWTFSKYAASTVLYSSTYGKYTYSMRFTITDASDDGEAPSIVYVNDGTITDYSSLYATGADGKKALTEKKLSVLTADGVETIDISGSGSMLESGTYVVRGSGWGHNVGMSQYGALAMARLGFTSDEIIKFYFTGVSVG